MPEPALLRSWGGLTASSSTAISASEWLAAPARYPSVLPYGNGRSYGDTCLNDGGAQIVTRDIARIEAFDTDTGLLTCGAGALLSDVLLRIVPAGWFIPVTPGTRFVTIGGAVANDVHGKNHHRRGTLGRHVVSLDLARSDGTVLACSAAANPDLFRATIGGMGLTGLITRVTLQLIPVRSWAMDSETIRFGSLDEFFALAAASDESHEYTVAWVDSLASGKGFGRGVFFRANHAEGDPGPMPASGILPVGVPFTPPVSLLNRLTLTAFNTLYRSVHPRTPKRSIVPYGPFFYPLDKVPNWNRAYGPRGLRQFQCAVPPATARDAVAEMLSVTLAAGESSFLTVLKVFGDVPSPGMMSFPLPGATLTLDFPNRGERTMRLLDRLDRIAIEARGRVNPYKDARMAAATFRASFPQWQDFAPHVDPAFSSSFWRRVSLSS